jgi:RNA polymerase subunit RPABC4/transcription elongation factor Spt4
VENLFQNINDIIASPIWTLLWYLLWFSIITLWLSLVFWTLKDARKRIEDKLIVAVAAATSLVFPFIGTLVYVMLRPAEYLSDVRERELEMRAMEVELRGVRACPNCREPVREDFIVCPKCRKQLRTMCTTCGRPMEYSWKVCPYCGQEAALSSSTTAPGTPRRAPSAVEQATEAYGRTV